MNQKPIRNQHEQESKSVSAKRQARSVTGPIAVLLVACVTAVYFAGCGGAADEQRTSSPTVDSNEMSSDPIDDANGPSESESEGQVGASDPEDRPAELKDLVGRWQRTDADYVLEIVSIDKNGDTQAAYFNPRPIHVAKAKAEQDGDTLKVFVELRDTGYPGCIYELEYYPQQDGLAGIYFQAAQQQKYPITFIRAE